MKKLMALLGGVGCVAALQGCMVEPDGSEESIATLGDNIVSSIAITTDWGSGYCANVTIVNTLAVPGNAWNVMLDMRGSTVQSGGNNGKNVWGNATANGFTGKVLFTPLQNSTINPGASTSFGFCANGSAPARAAMAGFNMTHTQYAACDSNSGVNPTRAALAVAMGTELGRWKPDQDLYIGSDGRVQLTAGGLSACTNGCPNTKALLAMQDDVFSDLMGQETFNATAYREDLKASFGRHYSKMQDLQRNNPGQLPPAHKLTLVGGPTSFGSGSCGPHYIYKATDLNNVPLTSAQASNLANALCFFGQGSCGYNPYIAFVNTSQGCPSGQTCVAIDPGDTDNTATSTTSAGSTPTYSNNKIWDPANTLLGTACMTTTKKLGTMKSKCSILPTTCGWLWCVANPT